MQLVCLVFRKSWDLTHALPFVNSPGHLHHQPRKNHRLPYAIPYIENQTPHCSTTKSTSTFLNHVFYGITSPFSGKQLAFESAGQESHACTKSSISQERAGEENFVCLSRRHAVVSLKSTCPTSRLSLLPCRYENEIPSYMLFLSILTSGFKVGQAGISRSARLRPRSLRL